MPVGWEVTEEVPHCELVAVQPVDDPEYFATNVVVTMERLDEETKSPDTWVARSRERLLDGTLDRLWIIDSEETEIDGRRAYRLLSHYLHDTHGGVNLEQWQVPDGERGYVVSCSTASLEYDALADVMMYIAEGFRVHGATS